MYMESNECPTIEWSWRPLEETIKTRALEALWQILGGKE